MFAATRSRCGGLALLVALLCAAAATPARGAVPGGYDVSPVDALAAEENLNVGGRIANVGDVNADGKADLALGVPAADGGQGRVVVVSGASGTSIYAVSSPFEAANTAGPANFGAAVAVLGDILRCPGAPSAGSNCDNKAMSGDGAPEFLVGATGGDVNSGAGVDQGRVYVIDGATGAIASRVMLSSDDLPGSGKAEFGSSVLSLGDTDGDGRPDFAVGAPGFTEQDTIHCSLVCIQAGRIFVYSGADLGGAASSPLQTPALTVDNPDAEADTVSQRFGHALAPLADIGRCVTPGGDRLCPDPTNEPDGTREFLVTVPYLDQAAGADAGAAVVIDGATGLVLKKIDAVDAQANGHFGLFSYSAPAPADMGGAAGADLLVGAPNQGSSGRAFVIDGTMGATTSLGSLPDPAPVADGAFGAAAGGLAAGGVVVGTPNASPATIHLFGNDRAAAQTLCDPGNQNGSQFGAAVTSLGDANGDGFDELAVGAPGFDRAGVSNAGRLYLFTTKAAGAAGLPGQCTATGGPTGAGGGGTGTGGGTKATPPKTGTVVIARVLRRLVLKPNRKRVRRNRSFRLRGRLTASANRSACQRRQKIALQRRVKGGRFQTFEVAVTRTSGAFTAKAMAQRTYTYRARVSQTTRCMGAVSRTARVSVLRKRGRR